MHRILKLQKTQLKSFQQLSTRANLANSRITLTPCLCTSCQKIQFASTISIASHSSQANPSLIQKKARSKRKKSNKKYTDLLVVTDNSTKEQKALVKRLNSSDLKILAQHNFNLSVLFKLKSPIRNVEEHTYNNLTVIPAIPQTSTTSVEVESRLNDELQVTKRLIQGLNENDAVYDFVSNTNKSNLNDLAPLTSKTLEKTLNLQENLVESDVLDYEGIQSYRNLGTFHPEVLEEEQPEINESEDVKETPAEVLPKKKHFEKKAFEEISYRTLAAYAEVCSSIKDPQRGLNAVYFHRMRSKRNDATAFPPLRDVGVFNALLKSFATKDKFSKIQEILKIIKEENVALNAQSFANILECLGRINTKDNHLKDIRIAVKEMRQHNLSFDDIMNDAIFTRDQRNYVLAAIKCYDPSYTPTYRKPKVQYNNHLLNQLNHVSQMEPPEISKIDKHSLFTEKIMNRCIHEQMEIEKSGYITVKSIEAKEEPTEDVLKYRKILNDHFQMWEEKALEAFTRDISTLSAKRNVLNIEPYLRSIPAKEFVAIIIDEAKKLAQGSETYSPTVNQLYREMGSRVYAKYKVLCKQKTGVLDKVMKVHREYCRQYIYDHQELDVLPETEKVLNSRQRWQWVEYNFKGEGASIAVDHQEWVPTVLICIGKFLYHIVMHDLKIDVNSMKTNKQKNFLPAFYTIFRNQGRIVKEEVKPHPVLSKLHRASVPETLTFSACDVPMKCPPMPWTSVTTGGYLIMPCEMVRLPAHAMTQKQRLQQAESSSMYPALDSLNQLAAVPWKVNEKILDIVLEVFNSGGSSKLDVPQPPSALLPPVQENLEGIKEQKFQNLRQKLQFRRKQAEMYSLWCDCLYRLSLANHFRKDIFWLPHNTDFRGRVYPIPPHLNHLGSDLARSMLVFAESRPLGPKGLDWLKLHLINLTGLKKRDCIEDRLAFANEVMDKILDSADYPLTGKMWWAQSEEPWQTLACCMEVAAAHRSPDPEQYRTHFPIHQDGSCNGLQHYAALGRDSAGAFSVNLTSSYKPQDVYSAVVALVEEQRAADAAKGLEIAKILEGFVQRKVIKQTVMTTVYGVTRFGARLQIARQLKDLENFPKAYVWQASQYLTTKTFESLRTMFTSTREIQDWFTECARLISSVGGKNVEWVTPLGLPIVQPYSRYKKVPSKGQNSYENFHMDKYEKPNVMKQKNAFPPNFIHSLDSSHMMLTSLFCERSGITFVSVHDCYWTHPSTVHIMNRICREQFVALHSEPILENLSLFLADKYSCIDVDEKETPTTHLKRRLNKVLRDLPQTSDFDIREVLNSVYFFS